MLERCAADPVRRLTGTLQTEHGACIASLGNGAHHHPAAGAGSSSCGSATDLTVTSREASGSCGHSAGSSSLFGLAGQLSSPRSASAAAGHPGAHQVLLCAQIRCCP